MSVLREQRLWFETAVCCRTERIVSHEIVVIPSPGYFTGLSIIRQLPTPRIGSCAGTRSYVPDRDSEQLASTKSNTNKVCVLTKLPIREPTRFPKRTADNTSTSHNSRNQIDTTTLDACLSRKDHLMKIQR